MGLSRSSLQLGVPARAWPTGPANVAGGGALHSEARAGDRINAVLAPAGYNFGLLLRWLAALLCA